MIAALRIERIERIETLAVTLAVAGLALAALVYAMTLGRIAGPPALHDWQVSAFAGLGETDQAIHSALSVAAEEIGWMNYDFGDWPPIAELEKLVMPPFYKDEFWQRHGRVEWRRLAAAGAQQGGDTTYIGTGGTVAGQSAYLLVYRHRHVGAAYTNQVEIWIHGDVRSVAPEPTKAEALVRAGWRQVVTYSGADERARFTGE
jgi:hypothetical protein